MPRLFDLTGEVALVTGATGGFGQRFVQTLRHHGAKVAASGRRAEVLAGFDRGVIGFYHDVRESSAALFDNVEAAIGPVTILVNNAGIGHADKAIDCPHETWRNVIDVDLSAPFLLAQEAARRMARAGRGGAIINVASVFGLTPTKGMVAYACAKAALVQLTKSLALEFADKGIRVNALAPGWCVTEMTRSYLQTERGASIARDIPLGRFGNPADLDGALLLLASDAGRYINGTTLVVDGGLSIGMRDGVPHSKRASPPPTQAPEVAEMATAINLDY